MSHKPATEEIEQKTKMHSDGQEPRTMTLKDWLSRVYDVTIMSDDDLEAFYTSVKFNGFDRDGVIASFYRKVNNPTDAVKLIILCAIRGPVKAHELALSTGLSKYGIPLKAARESTEISFSRITAATADIAAYYLKKLGVPKRLNLQCPAWLQFPSAGSIDMPQNFRDQHIEFCVEFSSRLTMPDGSKSVHRQDIYDQMVLNSYYDNRLGLF